MTITFFLKEPRAERPTPIIARVAFDGQKLKCYTGLSIEPRKWIQAAQLVQTRGNNQAGRFNDALSGLRARLEACFLEHVAAGSVPTAEQLRAAVDPAPAPSPESAPEPARPSLLAAYVAWDEQQKDRLSPNTRRSSATTLLHLRKFQEATGYVVDFDTITPVFAARFTSYLLTSARLTDNSIAKVLTRLKAFLRYAYTNEITERRDFERLKWPRREPEVLALTLTELGALEAVSLAHRPGLQNARDLFLLGCYTGLRYSDLMSLRPEHLLGERLRLHTQKTRQAVTIPLRPAARLLLGRLFAGELYPVCNSGLNADLKEIGRLAGLDTPTEKVLYRGGQRQVEVAPKYAFLTCHTSRRTFVTLALQAKIRPETIMKVTGHTAWATFKRYVAVSEQTVEKEFGEVYNR